MNPRVPRSRVTHDRWLVSYADFITLLFGLFVVMFAFAREGQKKQAQVSRAIDTAFRSMGVFSNPASQPANAADEATAPANAVMNEEVVFSGASEGRSGSHAARSGGDALHADCRAHCFSRDGPRWSGDQLARGGFLRIGLRCTQAGGAAHAPHDCGQARPHALRSCASRATQTMCPSTTRSSTRTGSFRRRALRTLRGFFWK
jgi:hypothetical protein